MMAFVQLFFGAVLIVVTALSFKVAVEEDEVGNFILMLPLFMACASIGMIADALSRLF